MTNLTLKNSKCGRAITEGFFRVRFRTFFSSLSYGHILFQCGDRLTSDIRILRLWTSDSEVGPRAERVKKITDNYGMDLSYSYN